MCALGDFLVLFAPVLRQIARYLPHHRSENASKTHPKSSHDKFKTASKFLKTGEIDKNATAKGLPEARERLRIDTLPDVEKRAYYRDMEALRYQRSVIKTGWDEGHTEGSKEGRAEGEKKKAKEVAKRMKEMGLSIKDIAQCTQLTHEEIEKL